MRIRPLGWLWASALAACAAMPPAAPQAGPAEGFAGTRWMGVMEGERDPRTLPRLEFVREGRFSGYTGCNMLSGTWHAEGGEVRVDGLVTTKRMCIGPGMETEKRVLAALRDGGRGRREGARLVFTGPRGERFEFVEAAAT
jgi:heat shock protein HslJ